MVIRVDHDTTFQPRLAPTTGGLPVVTCAAQLPIVDRL